MSEKKPMKTVAEENVRRAKLRTYLLSVGTPIVFVLLIMITLITATLLKTFFAEQKFVTLDMATSYELRQELNTVAITSNFMQSYIAQYNYATTLVAENPYNGVLVYMEAAQISPPDFVCYPVINGYFYSNYYGDYMTAGGALLDASFFYNYAEMFLSSAPACFGGSGGGSGDPNQEQSEGGGSGDSGEEQDGQSQYEQLQEQLQQKQEQTRRDLGLDTQSDPNYSGEITDEQRERNEEQTSQGEQTQRDTEDLREADREGNSDRDSPTEAW